MKYIKKFWCPLCTCCTMLLSVLDNTNCVSKNIPNIFNCNFNKFYLSRSLAHNSQGFTVIKQCVYQMMFRSVHEFKKRQVKSGLVWRITLSILLSMNAENISMPVFAQCVHISHTFAVGSSKTKQLDEMSAKLSRKLTKCVFVHYLDSVIILHWVKSSILLVLFSPGSVGPLRATVGPGETFSWGPKHFCMAPLGRKIWNFSFQNGAFWCIFVFLSEAGPPNVAGPGVPPYPTLSTGLLKVVTNCAKCWTFFAFPNFKGAVPPKCCI